MGMGDKKETFAPSYKTIRDDVNGFSFAPCCMQSCPHPNVISKYGVGGVAHVSIYTCRKCKFVIKEKLFGGVRCGYMEQ